MRDRHGNLEGKQVGSNCPGCNSTAALAVARCSVHFEIAGEIIGDRRAPAIERVARFVHFGTP